MPRRRPREIHRQQGLLTPSWLGYAPWVVLAAHSLLAIAYNLATPFGNNGYPNTPDEGAHFQYVAYVAREWRLPKFEGYEGVGYEAHQPPLYYFLAAVVYALTGGEGKAVRLLSTLCSAGVVWLVWLTLRRLAPERPLLALTGMGFAAFLPMHIAIGSAVGNDALTNLLFAAVLYALLTNLHNATASTTAPENSNPLLKVPPAGRGNRADSVPPAKREEPEKRDTHASVPLAKRGEPSPHSVPLAKRGEPAGGGRLYQLFLLPILTGLTLLTKATGVLLIPIMLLGVIIVARVAVGALGACAWRGDACAGDNTAGQRLVARAQLYSLRRPATAAHLSGSVRGHGEGAGLSQSGHDLGAVRAVGGGLDFPQFLVRLRRARNSAHGLAELPAE
jgi:hypothetical protein